jgi:hypothetical protein
MDILTTTKDNSIYSSKVLAKLVIGFIENSRLINCSPRLFAEPQSEAFAEMGFTAGFVCVFHLLTFPTR